MKNKFLYVFFAVTALLFCLVFSASASEKFNPEELLCLDTVENYFECYAAGDVDGDGAIKADDARFILRLSVGLESIDASDFKKADVDGDGKISAADARLALRLAVDLEEAPEHIIQEFVIVPATCSTDGITIKLCTSCMKIYAKITHPASDDLHTTAGWETVKKPDCVNKGLAQLKCIHCEKVLKESVLSPTGVHSGEWNYPNGKDCYFPVPKTRTCTVCGYYEEASENPPVGHNLKAITEKQATCTEDGIVITKCLHCGIVTKEEVIPALKHKLADGVIREATCTVTGLRGEKCTRCDYHTTEYETPALGHSFDNKHYKVTEEPTCSKEGTANAICATCGEAQIIKLEKTEHTLTGEWTVIREALCESDGERKGTCRYCGTVNEVIPATGHTLTEWVTLREATCSQEGLLQGFCSVCDESSATKTIEKLPHDYDTSTVYWTSGIRCQETAKGHYKCKNYETCGAKQQLLLLQVTCTSKDFHKTAVKEEATCTTKQVNISLCDYCEKPLAGTEKTTGSPLGHDFTAENKKVTKAATCSLDGEAQTKCSRCDEIKTEKINALGHEFKKENWKETKAAECTVNGEKINKCTRCDETRKATIAALGHDHNDSNWKTVKLASCTEAGEQLNKCTRCDNVKTREMEALGHEFDRGGWQTVSEADCTHDGEMKNQCTRCEYATKKVIPATGHTEGEWQTINEATCSEDGIRKLYCTECSEELDSETLEKTEHIPVIAPADDTYHITDDGNIIIKCIEECEVCGEFLNDTESVVRISVTCPDDLTLVFDEYTGVKAGEDVMFTLEGNTDNLIILLTYGEGETETIYDNDGFYYFTIPDSISDTETLGIFIARYE